MTTTTPAAPADSVIPDNIAEQIVYPEGHGDNDRLFEAYRWLRENNPLGIAEVDGYEPLYLVSKHADIMEIERHDSVFAAASDGENLGAFNPVLNSAADDEYTRSINNGSLRSADSLTYLDGDEHAKIRNIVSVWFRPNNLKKWEDVIGDIADQAVAKLLTTDGKVDFVKDFSHLYPLRVIMSLFGVPPEDEPRMMELTQELFGRTDPDTIREDVEPLSPDAAAKQWAKTLEDLCAYFAVLLADRRANPIGDLATVIAEARDENGEYFQDSYIFGLFIIIATAGHDTTSATLAGGFQQLVENPELLERIKKDPSNITNLVVESLRWASPAKHFMRTAIAPYEIRGRSIVPGDRFMLLYQSANRDADAFKNPDVFDIDRQPNRHIAFGYGPHMCLGHQLARMELSAIYERLLPHVESARLAGEPKYVATNFVGGLKTLPVDLTLV